MITSLEDMTDHEQIRDLSVKQLKLILQKNCINYKGCLEKQELLDKVVRLWQAREEEKIMQERIAQRGDTGNRCMCTYLSTCKGTLQLGACNPCLGRLVACMHAQLF